LYPGYARDGNGSQSELRPCPRDHDAALFPRWLAYVNIWAPITFTPGAILQFFKDGPFAWNGIFVFSIPATVFVIQFVVNVVYLLKAITEEEVAEEVAPAVIGGR
jgi:hypothetical protein